MTIQTVQFDATQIDNPEVHTRLFNSSKLVDDLEFHPEVTHGVCITGLVRDASGDGTMLGMWNRDGVAVMNEIPNLIQEKDVLEPDWRECWINIYRSTETPHGFTVGSKTGSEEDMRARGQRNAGGNYLGTVKLRVDLNDVNNKEQA